MNRNKAATLWLLLLFLGMNFVLPANTRLNPAPPEL